VFDVDVNVNVTADYGAQIGGSVGRWANQIDALLSELQVLHRHLLGCRVLVRRLNAVDLPA
jgi:hypothetical protein